MANPEDAYGWPTPSRLQDRRYSSSATSSRSSCTRVRISPSSSAGSSPAPLVHGIVKIRYPSSLGLLGSVGFGRLERRGAGVDLLLLPDVDLRHLWLQELADLCERAHSGEITPVKPVEAFLVVLILA